MISRRTVPADTFVLGLGGTVTTVWRIEPPPAIRHPYHPQTLGGCVAIIPTYYMCLPTAVSASPPIAPRCAQLG